MEKYIFLGSTCLQSNIDYLYEGEDDNLNVSKAILLSHCFSYIFYLNVLFFCLTAV